LCRSFDRAPTDQVEAAYMRLLTPVIKYWICKSAPGFLYEAMECLGGNGYIEEGILARHYRESPVNAIWEGSGNVMCLDVLRALSREPDGTEVVLKHLIEQTRDLPGAADSIAGIVKVLRRPDAERTARIAVEKLAQVAAAAALHEVTPNSAGLFAATRLKEEHGALYGSADVGDVDARGLLERALPSSK
ncbi:MAG TPA: acyl-CoA dehydrogenase family protein, partial [Xanthobacteraceae bacterium]